MTQENKNLLLKYLCAMLPYKPFAQWHHKVLNEFRDVKIMKISTYGKNIDDYHINVLCQPEPGVDYVASIVDIKPYLRPMSSMMEEEEEEEEYHNLCISPINHHWNITDWLNAHHFDYRRIYDEKDGTWKSMIEMGLALPAPEGMYNEK